MDYELKSVLQKGMELDYEYDFGSSTDLVIKVHDYRGFFWKKKKLTILSRNNPPKFLCDNCQENAASVIYIECMYDGDGFLCEDCREIHECGEEMQPPVCNSPRMGGCAYQGSDIYPDQFMPDRNR